MGNRQEEILSEIRELIISLKEKISELESKYEELAVDVARSEEISTEDDLTAAEADEPVSEDNVEADEVEADEVEADEVEADEVEADEVVADGVVAETIENGAAEADEPVSENNVEAVIEDEIVEEEALPFTEEEEVVDLSVGIPAQEDSIEDTFSEDAWRIKPALIDSMSIYSWRKDMPGTEVRDVRSAVSLNDRILFINTLFREDPVLFQNTIDRMNAMQTLVDVESYISENFPEWKMDSDTVYRFMMAVRRKVRR